MGGYYCDKDCDTTPLSRPLGLPKSTPNCFIVRDADGQQLAYVYFEDEPEIGGEIIGAGRGETNCRKYRETAGATRPPSDVGSAVVVPVPL